MKHGIVYRASGGMFPYSAWPTVCKDEKGVLYAVFSGHRAAHVCPFGKDLMCVSYDDGESWSAPMIVNDSELDDRDAGIVSLGDGKLLLSYFCHPRKMYVARRKNGVMYKYDFSPVTRAMCDAVLDEWEKIDEENDDVDRSGSYVRISKDSGKTWEKAVQAPVTAPHGPIMLKDGRLLYLGKRMTDVNDTNFLIAVAESNDLGNSWTVLCDLPLPDNFAPSNLHEPHVIELPNGRLVGAIRAHRPNLPVDENMTVLLSFSDDGGKTWTKPTETGVCGAPPHLMLHSSGALILTYSRRKVPFGQRAVISYDGGETFSEEVVINDKGKDWDLGYPSTVELSDGSLLSVYYQKLPDDSFNSILYTKWELPKR